MGRNRRDIDDLAAKRLGHDWAMEKNGDEIRGGPTRHFDENLQESMVFTNAYIFLYIFVVSVPVTLSTVQFSNQNISKMFQS